jgi:hypothetical protein
MKSVIAIRKTATATINVNPLVVSNDTFTATGGNVLGMTVSMAHPLR